MLVLIALLVAPLVVSSAAIVQPRNIVDALTCKQIETKISSASSVYYFGSANYTADNEHWLPSSTQESACTVQPGTAEDVSRILQILSTSVTPFAIKSGGHGTDAGVSSTSGVQIALTRLNSVVYHKASKTIELGTGSAWDAVYAKLEPLGVNVAGGRVVGVGVGGFILGGGYSWLSNRYGLAIDTVVSFEVVLPNGKIVIASADAYQDLFWGLKGGFNNFGVVTKVTMRAFPQSKVWGGLLYFAPEQTPKVLAALTSFQARNKDPDGNVASTYLVAPGAVKTFTVSLWYNAPTAPPGFFQEFLAIPRAKEDISSRTFLSHIQVVSVPDINTNNLRGEFNSISLPSLAAPVLAEVIEHTDYYGPGGAGSFDPGSITTAGIEPFLLSITNPNVSAAAYPHNRWASPMSMYYAWANETTDAAGAAAIRESGNKIRSSIKALGYDSDLVLYPNYALGTASIESLYGSNTPKLRALRLKYDPSGLMLRTGGYKFV